MIEISGTDDTDNGKAVYSWYASNVRPLTPPFAALGFLYEGSFRSAIIFRDFNDYNIVIHGWGGLTRQVIRSACNYAFNIAGVSRVTAYPVQSNYELRKALKKIGFVEDGGKLRHYYGRSDKESSHAIVMALFPKAAERWL